MSSSSNMILRSEESYKYKKCHRLYVPSEKNIKQMDFIARSTFNKERFEDLPQEIIYAEVLLLEI